MTNPDTPSELSLPAASTTRLYPASKQPAEAEAEEEEHNHSNTTSQYTDAGLLHQDVLLAIAEAETTEP